MVFGVFGVINVTHNPLKPELLLTLIFTQIDCRMPPAAWFTSRKHVCPLNRGLRGCPLTSFWVRLLHNRQSDRQTDRQTADRRTASQPAIHPNPGPCGCCPIRRFQHASAHHSLLRRGRYGGVVGTPHRMLGGQPPFPAQLDAPSSGGEVHPPPNVCTPI